MALLALMCIASGCSGCHKRRPHADGGTAAASETPERRAGHVGTVVGIVRLAEGAELPRYTTSDIGLTSDRPPIPGECTPFRDADLEPVRGVGTPTALVGMMVTAVGEPQAFFRALRTRDPEEHHVAIDDCRLSPRILVAMRGDTLVIENHTNAPFMPHVGPTQFYQTLMRGETKRIELDHMSVIPIQCGFSLGCNRTELVVLAHPVYSVTGDEGRFEMNNVPADQPIQIHAWHPLFLDAVVETRVPEGGRVEVELIARPRPPAPPAPPPADSTSMSMYPHGPGDIPVGAPGSGMN